ncbi:MAG: hypothetical protein EOS41_31025, partial [Mesorhizobium sp.]
MFARIGVDQPSPLLFAQILKQCMLNKLFPVVGNFDIAPSLGTGARFSLQEEEMHLHPSCASRARAILLVSSALIAANLATSASAQNSIRPRMTAAQCQPLMESNYALCCIAINRNSILSRAQLDQCPPLTTSLIAATLDKEGGGSGGGGG